MGKPHSYEAALDHRLTRAGGARARAVRVLSWHSSFWPMIGGGEVMSAELLTGLQTQGFELAVVADRSEGLPARDRFHGMRVDRLPFTRALERADMQEIVALRTRLRAMIRAFQPDIVHFHTLLPPAWFCGAVRPLGARLLVTRHELFDRGQPVGPDTLATRVMRQADWVACCCRASLAETRAHLPEIAPRSSVILNGLPFPYGVSAPAPPARPVVSCIGRLSEQKGFDLAVMAFRDVLDRFPTARLVIVGDGPERPALEGLSTRSGAGSSIEFTGMIPPGRIAEQIAASTIVLLPSRRVEGLPLVAIQAAQLGRPVVATRVGGLPEVVSDRETGLLVEPEDPRALGWAIAELLENPEAARRMGEAATRRARRDFTIDRFVSEYVDLYHRLMEEGRNAGIA